MHLTPQLLVFFSGDAVSVIPICMLVRHLRGMLQGQLSFEECDHEHASVIKMLFYHLQNMPQVKWCPASQGPQFLPHPD